MGTWIEISGPPRRRLPSKVVPYVGTWIEMAIIRPGGLRLLCRSLRGNVDRNVAYLIIAPVDFVVPYVGTWIEIGTTRIVE